MGKGHRKGWKKAQASKSTLSVPPEEAPVAALPTPKSLWGRIKAKKNDVVALTGLLCSFGSWGYTALNPQPQLALGLILIGAAFLCFAILVAHVLDFRRWRLLAIFLPVAVGFWVYAKKVVITPTHKRQMLAELQVGYGLRGECGSRTYYDQTPAWMRDAQERWKASVASLLGEAGRPDDLQEWSNSQLVGLVSDSNLNGFRCTEMAIKVGALEEIIAKHYDPTIKPNPYTGPVYVFNPATGGHEKK